MQADFSVSSSGDTYCAVPTNEFALAAKKNPPNKQTNKQKGKKTSSPFLNMFYAACIKCFSTVQKDCNLT